MKAIVWALPSVLAATAAFGQTAAKAEFEVASIKPSGPAAAGRVSVRLQIDGAQVHSGYLSLKDYLQMAYRLKEYQIIGPDWLASERFDINAKLPEGVSRQQVPEMLQSLLADRFKIKMHRDTKEFPVYALIPGKGGLKMKEAPADSAAEVAEAKTAPVNVSVSGSREGTSLNFGGGSYFTFGNNRIEAKKLTMPAFADTLARFMDRPVVDMTELKGKYDFALEFTPEEFRAMTVRAAITAGVTLPPEAMRALEGVSGNSLYAGIQSLGLKLEARKAPLEVLIIDRAEKIPTEN